MMILGTECHHSSFPQQNIFLFTLPGLEVFEHNLFISSFKKCILEKRIWRNLFLYFLSFGLWFLQGKYGKENVWVLTFWSVTLCNSKLL